jgi:hypothetical protein
MIDTLRDTEHDAGVEGNTRLTAVNGLVLTALLFVEGVTVLSVRGLLTLHVFVGLMLIPPVLLKIASTTYRFSQYYLGRPHYVRRGPPAIVLRLLGPLVVILTVALLGTGTALVIAPQRGFLLFAHKASFVLWFGAMTIHVIGHAIEALSASAAELRPGKADPAARRRSVRLSAIVAALILGVGVAAAFTPSAVSTWTHHAPVSFDH